MASFGRAEYLPWLLLTALVMYGAVLCLRASLGRRRSLPFLLLGLVCLSLSGTCVWTGVGMVVEDAREVLFAREHGIDIAAYRAEFAREHASGSYKAGFPASYFAHILRRWPANRAEVHVLARGAVARYRCLEGAAEKYHFFAPEGSEGSEVLAVWYGADDRVGRAESKDSYDPLPREWHACEPF